MGKATGLDLKAEQEKWIRDRFSQLKANGMSDAMAKEIIEGQIRQQRRRPGNPFLKGILGSLTGS
mgnify:CR=1 FL=1